jgi:type VII secretion-associated serine protease mycosin
VGRFQGLAGASRFGQNGGIVPPGSRPARSGTHRFAKALLRATAVAGLVALVLLPLNPGRASAAQDPIRVGQWHTTMLDAQKAWQYSTGAGVIVAVIDSGVSASHPDLRGHVLPGADYVHEGGEGTSDDAGHGTSVAALIAGSRDDGQGVIGLAPDARILPVRVLDSANQYRDPLVVADAIVWAVDHGARVINLSLGSERSDPALAEAIDYAFARDVVVVACAGNMVPNASSPIWHPAREPGVIAVSGLGTDGKAWSGSLIGKETVLAAPAAHLMGAKPKGYELVQGTSFAAPLVSATAALVRSRYPHMSAANVVQRLITTARDAGLRGRDSRYGFGIVDPVAALTRANVPAVDVNPLDTTPPPGEAGFGAAGDSVTLRSPPASGVPSAGTVQRPAFQARGAQARGAQASGALPEGRSWWGLVGAVGAVVGFAGGVGWVLRRL